MARTMKDTGIEWIGEIPETWEVVPSNILFCNSSIKAGEGVDLLTASQKHGVISQKRYIQLESQSPVQKQNLSDLKKVDMGDFVISLRSFQGGIEIAQESGGVTPAYTVLKERTHNTYNGYFKYFFKSEMYIQALRGTVLDTIREGKAIRFSNFSMVPLVLPTRTEQQKIAAILDEKTAHIDSITSKTKESIEAFKAYKQALITETVTKGLNPDVKMKDSGIEWIGEIPEHWKMSKMKRLGSVRNGLTYSPDDLVGEENGTLVLRSGNIQNANLSFNDNAYVSRTISDSLYVKKGDILICSRNGSRSLIGKNAIIDSDMKASFGAFMMIFRTAELSKYIYYILNSEVFNFYLGTFLTATINQLTKNNFDNMNVVFCTNPEEQKQIVAYLDEKCAHIDSLIADKGKLIGELEDYKKALIYEYVTGKKEVE